jgi:hypothetical protein
MKPRCSLAYRPDCACLGRVTARPGLHLFIVATFNARVNTVATIIFWAYDSDMAKPERGRPPKPDDERKSAQLRIRLTDEERAALDAAADGKTSTWARKLLLRAATKKRP